MFTFPTPIDRDAARPFLSWPALHLCLRRASVRRCHVGMPALPYAGIEEDAPVELQVIEGGCGSVAGSHTDQGSKMYSDTILASNPASHITTLASEREDVARRDQRAGAWPSASSAAQRQGQGQGHGGGLGQGQGRGLAGRVGGGQRWQT